MGASGALHSGDDDVIGHRLRVSFVCLAARSACLERLRSKNDGWTLPRNDRQNRKSSARTCNGSCWHMVHVIAQLLAVLKFEIYALNAVSRLGLVVIR